MMSRALNTLCQPGASRNLVLWIPIPRGGMTISSVSEVCRATCYRDRSASFTKLNEALVQKGGGTVFRVQLWNCWLVAELHARTHQSPPPSAGNICVDFDYEGETVYSFKYNAQMLVAQAVDIFNAGASSSATNGAVSANNLFEKICLWLKP